MHKNTSQMGLQLKVPASCNNHSLNEPCCDLAFSTRSDTNREDNKRLEISDLGNRGIALLCSENKGTDKLCSYHEAYLCLCFRICKKPVFS